MRRGVREAWSAARDSCYEERENEFFGALAVKGVHRPGDRSCLSEARFNRGTKERASHR
jgi:hypothetical protein